MELEKYREKILSQSMYDSEPDSGISRDIFDIGRGRVSPKLAKYHRLLSDIIPLLEEGQAELIYAMVEGIHSINPEIDGWAVSKAIESQSAMSSQQLGESSEPKKKGILSWLR